MPLSDLHAELTLVVVIAVLGCLIFSSLGADAVLLCAVVVLMLLGVIEPQSAVAGFANEGMLTVAALFVVAAGVRQTGAMSKLANALLGRSQSIPRALVRLTFPVAGMSALLNNTPIVAALMPAVVEWSRRHGKPASKFLIPLSYATILGGIVTVIGTSTNLVVSGLVEKNLGAVPGLESIRIFDITPVGLPVALIGLVVLVLLAPLVLHDRRPAVSRTDDPRMYTSEFVVVPDGPLVGLSIEDAGLRHLPGAFLAELSRGSLLIPAVEPSMRLAGGDRLIFVGPRSAVVDLQRIRGLVPAPDGEFRLDDPQHDRCLVEAVVAPGNPLCGVSIRAGEFRAQFHAVVVAVARDGHKLGGRLGDVVLEAGDVLLLECSPSWVENHSHRQDFYLASAIEDSVKFRHDRAWISILILVAMIGAAALEFASMFRASVAAAVAMVLTGCLSGASVRRAVDLPVLVAIATALSLGEAIHLSGLDQQIAHAIVTYGADNPFAAVCALYVGTAILTELVTNNAAAALMFPFALSLATQLGVSPMPFCVVVMFAASASFSTPIGYQTNLMVYGPGGYRFTDFFRIGIPLQLVCGLTTCYLVPIVFPF